MTERLVITVTRPIAGLRVYRVPTAQEKRDPRAAWLLGLREAQVREAERHAELLRCLDALQQHAGQIPEAVQRNLDQVISMATEIGLAVAREVVGEAVERGAVDPLPAVRRCVEESVAGLSGGKIDVRLHPEDLSIVVDEIQQEPSLRSKAGSIEFVPDPGLQRGSVHIDSPSGTLRYECAEVLDRISRDVRQSMAEVQWGGAVVTAGAS